MTASKVNSAPSMRKEGSHSGDVLKLANRRAELGQETGKEAEEYWERR